MNGRTIALLAVALGFAVGVFFMLSAYLKDTRSGMEVEIASKQRVVPPTIPTARVLVAKKDLIVGTFVKREDLHWQLWPEESITPAFVTDGQFLDATKSDQQRLTIGDFVGGVVRIPIAGGQPLVKGLIAKAGERGFLAAVLQPGMRAMSIPVSGTSAVSGFILPGDHVDILWDVSKSSKGVRFTQTLFRDIRVIAIDQKTSAAGATPAKTLTLELTPFQTEAMSLAQNMGGIEFTLRSIVPEKDSDSNVDGDLQNGLLAQVGLGRSDGIEKGALLGPELLAVAKEKEIAEVSRDSWTLASDLLYGGKPNKVRQPVAAAPRAVATGGNTGRAAAGGTPVSTGGGSGKIKIVRGTATQTVRVKK